MLDFYVSGAVDRRDEVDSDVRGEAVESRRSSITSSVSLVTFPAGHRSD